MKVNRNKSMNMGRKVKTSSNLDTQGKARGNDNHKRKSKAKHKGKSKGKRTKLNEKQVEKIRKMSLTQLAPLCDRMGRLLIDLGPHLASMGFTEYCDNVQYN